MSHKNRPFHQRVRCAMCGIVGAWQSERSFRTQVVVALAVIALLLVTRPDPLWVGLLLLTCAVVLAFELVNTSLEKLIDHVHPAQVPALRMVKDTLAGAVLVASAGAVGVFLVFIGSFLWA